MRRIALRFSLLSLTFIIGLSSVWLIRLPFQSTERADVTAFSSPPASMSAPVEQRPGFTPTSRFCGNGYSQHYETSDGQRIVEGSFGYETRAAARQRLKEILGKAARVVERVPGYKNRFGEAGERIVLVFPPDGKGHEPASILWFDGQHQIIFINAPSLELAREFEEAKAYAF
jgi:hypothetical protein